MTLTAVLGALALMASWVGGEHDFPPPTVRLGETTVRGRWMTSYNGRVFAAFRGIPYAKPPVGKLRFRNPQPAELETGCMDAVRDPPVCIHEDVLSPTPTLIGQEDCLYLNIYSHPKRRGLPVIVYVHGAFGWFVGSGVSSFSGPEYLMDRDVVLVTFNYRLGVFGFLSTDDAEAPGNVALKDQVMVLRWVRRYVAAFGGDPDCVTLFGQSAGSVSVHLHLLSPMSTGLFQRAISMSGGCVAALAFPTEDPELLARRHAALVGCDHAAPTRHLVACLRTVDAAHLVRTTAGLKEWWVEPLTIYRPTVETSGGWKERFLPQSQLDIIRDSLSRPEAPPAFTSVPWMTGVVSEEGILRSISVLTRPAVLHDLNWRMDELMPVPLELARSTNRSREIWLKIKHHYFPHRHHVVLDESTADVFTDIHTDRHLNHPLHNAVLYQRMAGHKDIFVYRFEYRGIYSYTTKLANTTKDYGVCHCDDLQYVVPAPARFPDFTADRPEWEVVDALVTLWTNFAKHGRPTAEPAGGHEPWTEDTCVDSVEDVQWSRVTGAHSVPYLQIAANYKRSRHWKGGVLKFCMRNDLRPDQMAFWDSLPLVENALQHR